MERRHWRNLRRWVESLKGFWLFVFVWMWVVGRRQMSYLRYIWLSVMKLIIDGSFFSMNSWRRLVHHLDLLLCCDSRRESKVHELLGFPLSELSPLLSFISAFIYASTYQLTQPPYTHFKFFFCFGPCLCLLSLIFFYRTCMSRWHPPLNQSWLPLLYPSPLGRPFPFWDMIFFQFLYSLLVFASSSFVRHYPLVTLFLFSPALIIRTSHRVTPWMFPFSFPFFSSSFPFFFSF